MTGSEDTPSPGSPPTSPGANQATSSPSSKRSNPPISLVQIPSWVYGRLSTLERLSIAKCNWPEWSRRILNVLCLCGGSPPLKSYVDGKLSCPDAGAFPLDYANWSQTNSLVIALVEDYVEDADLHLIASSSSARGLWLALENRHVKRGAYAQLMTIQELFRDDLDPANTTNDIENQARRTAADVSRMFQMGPLSEDTFTVVVLLHKMKAKMRPLMNQIVNDQSTSSVPLTADRVLDRIKHEAMQVRADRASGTAPLSIALAATSSQVSSRVCSNCKCKGHLVDRCWQPGGGAEGQREQYLAKRAAGSTMKPDGTAKGGKPSGQAY
ncbi:hypothetical protein BD310DRAFT_822556, partial [Dichomitus squalens]